MIIKGAAYGPNVRKWGDSKSVANLGHCFIAIDPSCFAPGFEDRLSDLMTSIRNMEPVIIWWLLMIKSIWSDGFQTDPKQPVLVAGDPERLHMKAADEAGGVRYVQDQHNTCVLLSKELKVEPLKSL